MLSVMVVVSKMVAVVRVETVRMGEGESDAAEGGMNEEG
jgi:hypothetical protein